MLGSYIGLKVAAVLGLVLLGSAAALLALSQDWAQSLGHRATNRGAQALRAQAMDNLHRLTTEQADHLSAQFERTRTLSQLLAARTENLLARPADTERRDLNLSPAKGMLTNSSEAPVSVVYLPDTQAGNPVRREMARIRPIHPMLVQARERAFSGVAAWFTSEAGYVCYAPNLPLVEELPPDEGYDAREGHFYRAAGPERNPQHETVWTRVYQDPAGQGLMVTASTPVYGPQDRFRGVVGIDLTLQDMVERIYAGEYLEASPLKGAQSGQNRFHFLVEPSGRIIAFPLERLTDFGLPARQHLPVGETLEFSLRDSRLEPIAGLIPNTTGQDRREVVHMQLNGTGYFATLEQVPSTGWLLGHVVAEESVVGAIERARQEIDHSVRRQSGELALFALALLGGALLIVVGYVIFSLVLPLRRLAEATDALRQGSYGVHVPAQRSDELGQTGRAFNELSDRLSGLIHDLEDRVAERTAEAEAARHHFQSILENSPVGIAFLDGQRRFQRINPALKELTGYSEEAFSGQTTRFLYASSQEYIRVGREAYPELMEGGTYETETQFLHADGRTISVSLHGRAVNPSDLSEGFIWVLQDVSEHKRLEEELRLLAVTFRTNQATFITDAEGTIERVNPAFTTITGYEPEEVIGESPRLFKSGAHGAEFYHEFWNRLLTEGHWEGEVWNRLADGRVYPLYETVSVVRDEQGQIEHFVSVFHNISEQKRLEAELSHQASHDRLTGVYNRKRFEEELSTEVERAQRYGTPFSLLMFDIDHFKAVNDAHGHHTGDEVLVHATQLITHELRAADSLARWGGEEFMVLLPETSESEAIELAERLRRLVLESDSGDLPSISISLGVTTYRADERPEDLTRRLDEALYRAKAQGRNRVEPG